MINIKSFNTLEQAAEMNEFLNTAKMKDPQCRVEIIGDYTHIVYEPELDPKELEKISVAKRLRAARENLVEMQLHKAFLGVVMIEDAGKLDKSKDNNALEIRNLEEQIKLYETWEVLNS